MARIDSIFKGETKKAEAHPKRVTKWIHYTKLKTNKKQYRYGQSDAPEELENIRERVEALADLIATDGEVLQDLLVRKIDTDEYEIVAGHYRRDACKLLVEERGEEKYALLPCIEKNISDVRAEFQVYSSNGYGKKTQYEIMCELEGMQHLLETYPEEFPDIQGGRMIERLAKRLNMDKTTVGDYQRISRKLGDKGMEKFREGTLKKSAALELTGLTHTEQNELIDNGITSSAEITKYKQEKELEGVLPVQKRAQEENMIGNVPESGTTEQAIIESVPESGTPKQAIIETVPKSGTCEKVELYVQEPAIKSASHKVPIMKNMEQREAFVRAYEAWPIWAKNELTEETYFRFDLSDGSAIVIREYPYTSYWEETEEKGTDFFLITEHTKHFKDAASNMTMIKEHLKNI